MDCFKVSIPTKFDVNEVAQGMEVSQSTTLLQTEKSQQRSDGLPYL